MSWPLVGASCWIPCAVDSSSTSYPRLIKQRAGARRAEQRHTPSSMCLIEALWGSPGGDGVSDTLGGGVGLGRVISDAIGTLACMCVPLSVDGTVVCLASSSFARESSSFGWLE